MNLGNLGRLPLTALQPGLYLRSRVTLTAFDISRSHASASATDRLREQSFVFSLNFLNFLKFLIVCHALVFVMPLPQAYGFAVIPNGMDIPGSAVSCFKLPIIQIIRSYKTITLHVKKVKRNYYFFKLKIISCHLTDFLFPAKT